jgi:small subunit ribosomal protein S15
MATGEKKQAATASLAVSKNDTGSSAVQAANLTKRIELITGHVKENKHDYMARRGLLQLVGQRRRLLQYIAKRDPKQYLEVVKTLGLRH